jgi:hypothetical protein
MDKASAPPLTFPSLSLVLAFCVPLGSADSYIAFFLSLHPHSCTSLVYRWRADSAMGNPQVAAEIVGLLRKA